MSCPNVIPYFPHSYSPSRWGSPGSYRYIRGLSGPRFCCPYNNNNYYNNTTSCYYVVTIPKVYECLMPKKCTRNTADNKKKKKTSASSIEVKQISFFKFEMMFILKIRLHFYFNTRNWIYLANDILFRNNL